MEVIETRIDPRSEAYRQNYEAMAALVTTLKEELRIAREDRSPQARNRLASQGKMPMREKLDLLLDRNTPFLETSPAP